jgi:PAS domain S-box-containing protein
MSDIFDKQRKAPRWLAVVPFVTLVAVLLLEFETPGIRVTPSLLTIAVTMFALFLPPRAVLWWAIALFFPVVLTLWLIPNTGVRESLTFVALRSAAYIAVAWVAVGLSRYRWDSERRLEGLLALFDSLQTPIVVSDIDGNIKFANRACCEVLGRSAEKIKDTNFFSVFSQPDRRGQSIEDYLKRFDQDANQSASMFVSIQNATGGKMLHANCVSMQWDHQRLLVTQLS